MVGVSELLAVVAGLVAVLIGSSATAKVRSKGPVLVLQEFSLDTQARTVTITGRAPGLLNFILTTMGLDTRTSLYASPAEIRFRSTSLSGHQVRVSASSQIATLQAGTTRPIALLFLAGVIMSVSLGSSVFSEAGSAVILAGFLVAGLLIATYALMKEIGITVESTGHSSFGLRFRRSVIENVAVDINKATEAIDLIAQNVVLAQRRAASARPAPPPPPPVR